MLSIRLFPRSNAGDGLYLCFCMCCFSVKSDHVLGGSFHPVRYGSWTNQVLLLVRCRKFSILYWCLSSPLGFFFWHSWHEPQYVIPKLVSLQWLATGYPRGKQGGGLNFKVFVLNSCCLLPTVSANLNSFARHQSFPNKCMGNGCFSHLTKGRRLLLPWEMWYADWYCKIMRCHPSLSSWLEEDDDPVVAKVNQRMQQITGLTVKTAELLQVGALASSWWNLLLRVVWWRWMFSLCVPGRKGWRYQRNVRTSCRNLRLTVCSEGSACCLFFKSAKAYFLS